MSWFVVGGIAIGATAGAIYGSQKGGDDVWKDALIGGAIGGTAGYGAGALAPAAAAEAAVPAAVGAEGGAGILGAEAVAGGSGLALGGAGLETGGAMAGGASGAGIVGAEGAATGAGAGGMGLGQAGGFAGTPAFGGSGASFGTYGGAAAPEGAGILNAGFAPGMQAPIQMIEAPVASSFGGGSFGGTGGATVGETGGAYNLGAAPQSPLEKGFGSAMSWLSEPKNAMLTGVLGLGALSMFNNNNEDNFGGSTVTPAGYPLSPNFKPSRYQPTRTYASGGIADVGSQNKMYPQSQIPDRMQFSAPTQMPASMEVLRSDYDSTINPYTGDETRFKTGGDTSKYQAMIDPRMNVKEERAPRWVGASVADVNDPGIYIDRDEDTKYQDALTAAQTRMGKAAKGANVQLAAMQKPKPLGGINLGPVAGREEEERKATGGITGLGGYAHGGNPRLLRGPGDGMSDDIPATIADKQPARLADGEFVVPADVVSGLGNGSTEAGAKKLHQMMDKVRVDRTGTKKQGKQINADKYVPGAKAEKKSSGGIASYAGGSLVVNPETNEVGYYKPNGDNYWETEWVPYDPTASSNQTTPAPTANTKAQGYNPDYYNPQYWQDQLPGAQAAVDAFAGQKSFDPNYYLTQYQDVAADRYWSKNPLQHYQEHGIQEGRSPYEGGQAGVQLLDTNAQQAAQQTLQNIQSNINRLANSSIKYDPYTLASRPSSAEPQFYGNIYRPQYPDYSTPGYTLTGGNLGEWSNVAGETARAAQPASKSQQITQAYLQGLGRAPDTGGFNYWMEANAPIPDLVRDIQTSQEARQNPQAVAQYYQDLLGRAPDAEGLKFWQTAANSGTNPDLIKQQMMTSPEYQVRQMYEQNLGRTADQAGQQFWTNAITQQGHSLDEVRQAIQNTDEGKAYAAAHPKEENKRKGGIASLKRRK